MRNYDYLSGIPLISTFSIAAANPSTGEVGVAVQSKFLAVGAAVPWVSADAGTIATQSAANTSYGPRGLAMLRDRIHPSDVIAALIADDENRDTRQVGVVDRQGRSATFTGSACFDYAGGLHGENFAVQGNILAGEPVVSGLREGFLETGGTFADRLLAALSLAQANGGDRRGMQSAALYIAKPKGGYGGFNDRYVDLRVDDHKAPIDELKRLLTLQRLYFERSTAADLLPLTGERLVEVEAILTENGYQTGVRGTYDKVTKKALEQYFLTENFEERWTDAAAIDRHVFDYMIASKSGRS